MLSLLLSTGCSSLDTLAHAEPLPEPPPAPPREFRGLWIPTVGNSNWPSKPGLTTKQQKAELIALLDRAVRLHINAVVFQVRPDCDALYDSKIEPWSEYITGTMGQPPSPYYDPLAFAITEAHKRGLELHAWFNPYRVRLRSLKGPVSAGHISRTHPEIVRTYGKYLWLDPAEKATRDYSQSVIMDVVHRYDVDGIHFDDYFYPYQEHEAPNPKIKGDKGKLIDFPDEGPWKRYVASGGKMVRNDWRRENVNTFVQSIYHAVKAEKRWVKFGISPFGIWQPGYPAQIKGLNSYDQLYADSRKWLANGWVDYLAPQLYWRIDAHEQSFPVLLKWWADQNPMHRHLWPGIELRPTDEVVRQMALLRKQPSPGAFLWHAKVIMENRDGVSDALETRIYNHPALVPSFPWLGTTPPPSPLVTAHWSSKEVKVKWKTANEPWQWVVQEKFNDQWVTEILPGNQKERVLKTFPLPKYVYVSAVDRVGNISAPVLAR